MSCMFLHSVFEFDPVFSLYTLYNLYTTCIHYDSMGKKLKAIEEKLNVNEGLLSTTFDVTTCIIQHYELYLYLQSRQ